MAASLEQNLSLSPQQKALNLSLSTQQEALNSPQKAVNLDQDQAKADKALAKELFSQLKRAKALSWYIFMRGYKMP